MGQPRDDKGKLSKLKGEFETYIKVSKDILEQMEEICQYHLHSCDDCPCSLEIASRTDMGCILYDSWKRTIDNIEMI